MTSLYQQCTPDLHLLQLSRLTPIPTPCTCHQIPKPALFVLCVLCVIAAGSTLYRCKDEGSLKLQCNKEITHAGKILRAVGGWAGDVYAVGTGAYGRGGEPAPLSPQQG